VTGGVAASGARDIKNNPPDPSSAGNGSPPAVPNEAGDEPAGEPPRFTVERPPEESYEETCFTVE
jgi:hypothetical protein